MCVPKKVFLALVVFAEKEEIEVGNGKRFYIIGFAYAYAWGGRERGTMTLPCVVPLLIRRRKKKGIHVEDLRGLGWGSDGSMQLRMVYRDE
jgi:hypothetical protein